jgi:hypothetical protein
MTQMTQGSISFRAHTRRTELKVCADRKDERELLDHDPCGAALTWPLRHLCGTPQLDSQQ